MDIRAILDQLDEIIYLSDPKTYELLYLNRRGRTIFGSIAAGAKCYEHLQGANEPCAFCTNEILYHSPDHRHTWVRRHPAVGTMLLHDSLVEYAGRLCRMEEAIDINRYMDELQDAKLSLAAERELAEQLHKQSRTDWLTGFWNRFAYDEILDALQEEQRRNQTVGVGFADLNRLKWINDNLGHDYGNKALLLACELMRETFPANCLYRISGDEFVVIQPEIDFAAFTERCKKFAATLREEKQLATFGYAWGQAECATELLRKAEQAMYDNKRKFYMGDGKNIDRQRPEYLDDLLREYREGEFLAYLQPLYSLKNSEVYGAEVLVRRVDADGKIRVPIEFIRMMEQERIVSLVDYEMLRQSCELLVKWKFAWPSLVLNVNFSRVTIHEADCVARVDEILRETGADPKQIIIEITESSQDMQFERMAERLSELKSRGFSIALDDMGTEAACLEMLYLPQLDIIKIDRSLICRSVNSEREEIVIEGLIDLCHRLGMTCVAEGIETEEQVELLKQLNCDRLQGYHIGKPMPAQEFFERFGPRNLGDVREETGGDGEYSRETKKKNIFTNR